MGPSEASWVQEPCSLTVGLSGDRIMSDPDHHPRRRRLLCPLRQPLRPGSPSRLERAQFPLGVRDLALLSVSFVVTPVSLALGEDFGCSGQMLMAASTALSHPPGSGICGWGPQTVWLWGRSPSLLAGKRRSV